MAESKETKGAGWYRTSLAGFCLASLLVVAAAVPGVWTGLGLGLGVFLTLALPFWLAGYLCAGPEGNGLFVRLRWFFGATEEPLDTGKSWYRSTAAGLALFALLVTAALIPGVITSLKAGGSTLFTVGIPIWLSGYLCGGPNGWGLFYWARKFLKAN